MLGSVLSPISGVHLGFGTQLPVGKGDYCIFFLFFCISSPFDMLTAHRAPLPSVKADRNVNSQLLSREGGHRWEEEIGCLLFFPCRKPHHLEPSESSARECMAWESGQSIWHHDSAEESWKQCTISSKMRPSSRVRGRLCRVLGKQSIICLRTECFSLFFSPNISHFQFSVLL